MGILRTVAPGAIVLLLVIFVHELGHFLMAKARGVRVLRFSFGFGPPLVRWTRGATEYRVAWFPLGGYVQMAGEAPGENDSMPQARDEYLSHPWFGRVLIALAGPLANLVTAYLLMVAAVLVGVRYPDYPNVLGATPDTTAAYRVGLREGDRIVQVAGHPVHVFSGIYLQADRVPRRRAVPLTVERGGRTLPLALPSALRDSVLSALRPPADPPVIGAVAVGMPAYKAGLKEGDRILSVNGQPMRVWSDLPAVLRTQTDKPVVLRVARGDRTYDLTVTPMDTGEPGAGARIGIEPPRRGVYIERHGFLESVDIGIRATGSLIASVYGGMWLTVSRPLYYREYLGGPLFIAQAASEQARKGIDSFLQFVAMINIALMAFNLLPIPILDGGHILLALYQAVRGRAISARGYIRFQKVGLVVVGALFILILANDPWRILQRQRALGRAPQEKTVAPSPP